MVLALVKELESIDFLKFIGKLDVDTFYSKLSNYSTDMSNPSSSTVQNTIASTETTSTETTATETTSTETTSTETTSRNINNFNYYCYCSEFIKLHFIWI